MKVTQYNSYKEYSEAKSKIKHIEHEEGLKNEGFWREKSPYRDQQYFYEKIDFEKFFKDIYKEGFQDSTTGFIQAMENASEVQNYEGLTEEEIIRVFDNLNNNNE